ncbi:DUF6221 family protein [Streptomyces sioyaensis]|uniref:DUF6221 family protein n=1 Tax=Streptomyces sioyaensis TaxID=67364 RepID=UPI0037B3FB92
MTEQLVAFLRARYDEDEEAARAATPGPWEWTPEQDLWDQNGPTLIRAGHDGYEDRPLTTVLEGWGHDAWGMHVTEENQTHIARHNPARVLAEVEAKRAIVDRYAEVQEMDREDAEPEFAYGRAVGLGQAVRLLALPYQEHPDYRPEWRP